MLSRLVLISAIVFSGEVLAQADPGNSVDLGTIVVEEDNVEAVLSESSIPVTVVNADQFHGRNISLNEVLKRVAGVRLAEEGGLGSRATLSINGLEGKRIKVFIDGKPMRSSDGSFGLNDIPIQLVERIEIYKGVVPTRFGGNALGGAVNVVSRSFADGWADLTYSMGSFNTHRAAAILTKRFEEQNIELGVSGIYNRSDNDYQMQSPYIDGLKINRNHDAYESSVGSFSLTFEDRWFDVLSFDFARYYSEKQIQGIQFNIQQAKNRNKTNFLGMHLEQSDLVLQNLSLQYDLSAARTTAYYVDKAEQCLSFNAEPRPCPGVGGEITGIPHDSANRLTGINHDVNLDYEFNAQHALNIHWNSEQEKLQPNDPLASSAVDYDVGAFPSKRRFSVSSISLDSSLFGNRIKNETGLKNYNYDYQITAQERALTSTPARPRNTGEATGWYESLRYSPLKGLFLKASYEHGFRMPDSGEIFGDGLTIVSSPDLKPEESKNINIGGMYESFQIPGVSWFKAEATWFRRDLTDMIKLVNSQLVSKYQNLGQISVSGFEVDARTTMGNWQLHANYTVQEHKDDLKKLTGTISTPSPTYRLDVPNVPKQFANLSLEYQRYGLFHPDTTSNFFWETSWVDEYFYAFELSRFQNRRINSQTTHTAGFEYSFHDDEFVLGFEIRNLTDEDVTDVYNHPLPGRSYWLNLRYSMFH